MKFNFLPKDDNFFELFSRSSKNVVAASTTFKELLNHWDIKSDKIDKIHQLEKEGDLLRHELVDKLNRTFITPIDREDIYTLSSDFDDIIDMIQACTDRMQIYKIAMINDDMKSMADILEKSAILLDKAVNDMPDKKKTRRVMDYLIEVNQLENEGDNLLRKLLRALFNDKHDNLDTLEIIKLKETYEAIESAIDKCEDVACNIETIVVKHS